MNKQLLTQAVDFNALNKYLKEEEGFKFADKKIGDIVSAVLPYVFVLAGLALLLMLIFGGFQLMTSAGDPKGMEAGKNRVMYAIVGFLIIFVSFWLVQILQVVFGLPKIF